MTSRKKNDEAERRLANILSYFERSLVEASDEEILRDLQANGEDLLKVGEETRFAIDGAIDRYYAARAKVLRERQGAYSSPSKPESVVERTSTRGSGTETVPAGDQATSGDDVALWRREWND